VGQRSLSGANLLARWNREIGGGSTVQVLGYYDRTNRRQPDVAGGVFFNRLDTWNLELQHNLQPSARHKVVYGFGHRYSRDRTENSATLAFFPPEKSLSWSNLLLQDEIALKDNLALTLGAKLERNVYTGGEFLPNVRLGWQVSPRHLIWGSLARAVRAPSRIDRDFFSPSINPLIRGGPDFVSEVSNVAEVGYRGQLSSALSLSVTGFYHDHERLRSIESGAGGGLVIENGIEGRSTGIETWANWQVARQWRLTGGLTLLDQTLRVKQGVTDLGGLQSLGNDPSHWWTLRSLWDITAQHTFDLALRRIGALDDPAVPAYTSFNARLGWQVTKDLNIALMAENLFDRRHAEWGVPANRVEHERSFLLQLLLRL